MNASITLSDIADDSVRKAILAPLVAYNDAQAGPGRHTPLVLALRDEAGAVIGGLWGVTGYEWLFVQYLAVPAELRGRGVGTELLRKAEHEARVRGCHGVWLDTFDFQARPFYESLGYTCFGELPDYPKGHARFFMRKTL